MRTIVLLCAKRSGSTAVFKMFQRHPDVGVCHIDQKIDNYEPNFWNLAVEAIEGNPELFIQRFKISHPFLNAPKKFTEENVFSLWEDILRKLGPVVFDKSPQYLGNKKAIDLLLKYKNRGKDVRIFGLVRDPRDTITSQYSLWKDVTKNDSLKRREMLWIRKYEHLNTLQIPVFRYEDFAIAPECYGRSIFAFAGVTNFPKAYSHVKPVNIGRYSVATNFKIRKWNPSKELWEYIQIYGYPKKQKLIGVTDYRQSR